MANKLSKWKKGLIAVASVLAALFISYRVYERKHQLRFVPAELGVSSVLYAKQASWGFAPSGREVSVIVYELPEETAAAIQKTGLPYFSPLTSTFPDDADWRGLYAEWIETPLTQTPPMFSPEEPVGANLSAETSAQLAKAFAEPGTFIGSGRPGQLIVMPVHRRAVFVHQK